MSLDGSLAPPRSAYSSVAVSNNEPRRDEEVDALITRIGRTQLSASGPVTRIRLPGRWPRPLGISLAATLTVTLATGCATTGRPGEIPVGTWSGRGTLVYETWKSDRGTGPADRHIHRTYATSLSVRPGKLAGLDILELEIISERGFLPGLDDEKTHLKVALADARRVSDSTVVYRMVGPLYNPDPDEKLTWSDKAPVAAACTTTGGITMLSIQYAENFVDIIRFVRGQVEKTGIIFDPEGQLIHWSEQLRRQD